MDFTDYTLRAMHACGEEKKEEWFITIILFFDINVINKHGVIDVSGSLVKMDPLGNIK